MAASTSPVLAPASSTNHNRPTKHILHTGLNSGNHTWTISDKKLISRIINAKNGELFESLQFKMCNLLWTIRLYPNGNNSNSRGSVKIFLKLVTMPYTLDQIILSYTTLCPLSQSSSTALDIYLKNGDSKGWLNRSLLINEWKQQQINLNIIQIIVSINIFKIKFKKYYINSILSHYRFNQNDGHNQENYQKKQKLVYKIDNYTLNRFKQSYYGKRYESVIFNNMWRIRWFPNGANHDCASYMSIYLVLCKIPYKISKLTTKYRIICKELNRSISAVDDFSFSASNWGKSKFIALQDIAHLKQLTFIIEIEILNEIKGERNDYEIWDDTQINYVLSMNDTNITNNNDIQNDYDNDNHPVPNHNQHNNNNGYFDEGDEAYNDSMENGHGHGHNQQLMKKEIKSLKKKMVVKDKTIDQLNNKINNLKTGLKEEVHKRNKMIQSLSNKINELEQHIFNNHNDEEKQMNLSMNDEIINIKQKLAELQSAMDGNIAKQIVNESSKRHQLKLWLINKAELPQYFDILIENGFEDLLSLKDLTKEYLQEMGIDKIGHQLKILRLVRKLDDDQDIINNNNDNHDENIMAYNVNNHNGHNNHHHHNNNGYHINHNGNNSMHRQYNEGQYTVAYAQ